MMDSSVKEREMEQSNDYYVENTVFVAVGKQVEESESVLMWAVEKFAKKKMICILHIHQPAHLVGGKFTISKFKQRAIKAFHESNMQKLHKLLNEYVVLLSETGVRPDRMWIEMDSVEEGIVNMIVQHSIKWLVMGAAADKHYTKGMKELKSRKAIFVCERAPPSCHIWFTCRGNLIYTREGRKNNPSISTSQVRDSLLSNMVMKESDHARCNDPGVDASVETRSPGSNVATGVAAHVSLDDPNVNSQSQYSIMETRELEPESPDSSTATEEHPKVCDPRADSQDSRGITQESELESPDSNASTEEEEEEEEEEEDDDDDDDDDDLKFGDRGLNTLSLDWVAASQESEHLRSDPEICSKGSPPRLTFRERGAILRACSVDLSSHEENFALLPSPQHSRALSDGVKLEKGSHEINRNEQIFSFQSSSNSALGERKKAAKARLGGQREILDKLERAILNAENLKQMAFQESVNRWKAEEDAMDTKNKAEAAESKYCKEMKRRKEIEEELEKQRLECERFEDEHEEYRRELLVVQDQCSALQEQIRESEHSAKELEEKIISAVQLLISFKEKRDQLRIECDKAIQELEILRGTNQQRTARLSGPQFSTFSIMEIDEATSSFDPSQRIGDGKYGSVYRGILRHMDVAIRMLPNDGSQGQWRFEREVEVLSRVRHPNILMLIGICPEARSIVYEYLENGSLYDHLVSKGKYPPLKWQTRVRIATELCSALVFLHTNNPPIFHGTLKPTKILLDANLISKIGDLGIFRLIPQNQIPPISRTVYTDPEFLETGVFTLDSDVYSFGVILLLLLTGRPPSGLVKDVRSALRKDKLEMVLDFSAGDWPIHQAKRLAWMGLLCCDRKRSNRPELASEVWSVLEPLRKSCNAHASCLEKKENRQPPSHFICPIYKEVMQDPCTAADGYTYERDAISGWLDSGHKTSPMTNLELSSCDLIPNHALQYAIQEWLQTA